MRYVGPPLLGAKWQGVGANCRLPTGRSYQRQDHRQRLPRLAQVLRGCRVGGRVLWAAAGRGGESELAVENTILHFFPRLCTHCDSPPAWRRPGSRVIPQEWHAPGRILRDAHGGSMSSRSSNSSQPPNTSSSGPFFVERRILGASPLNVLVILVMYLVTVRRACCSISLPLTSSGGRGKRKPERQC